MRELGYVDGSNIAIEDRFVGGREDRVAELAAELVALRVDVIVAVGTPRAQATKQATDTIPIVMLNVSDPVQAGLVDGLSRPGANVTGMSSISGVLAAKRLEILKEAMPHIRRVAVLSTQRWRDPSASAFRQWAETQTAAQVLGVEVFLVEAPDGSTRAESVGNLERAFQMAVDGRADALTVLGDALFDRLRSEIADAEARHRLPVMHLRADYAEEGGLMAYGPNVFEQARRAAILVDKILKGANPADLPVEQPTVFDFVINLRTAESLGLSIPPSVLAQATKVIW